MTTLAHGSSPAEWRAAGTDLSERRRNRVSGGSVRDIAPTPLMRSFEGLESGGLRIGASVTVADVASAGQIVSGFPGLAATAAGLATPQIRNVATLGGNLAQRNRCWYFRHPDFECLKKGGSICPARDGNHRYGVAYDLGPCVAPHASSMAAALMAYDAEVTTDQRSGLAIAALLGDGSDGTADNALLPGEMIQHIDLPPPTLNERAGYRRAVSRSLAEWPLAEVVVRAVVQDGIFTMLRLAAGGVAPVPLRFPEAETTGQGAPADRDTIERVARATVASATPLPMTGYKPALLEQLFCDVMEQCLQA